MRKFTVVLLLLCFGFGMAIASPWPASQEPGSRPQATIERDVTYGQADGVDLKLDMARPASGAGPFPVVLCIHGGAWQTGSKSGYAAVLPILVADGYAAVAVEYRFAPAFKYPAQLDDVRQAIRYL